MHLQHPSARRWAGDRSRLLALALALPLSIGALPAAPAHAAYSPQPAAPTEITEITEIAEIAEITASGGYNPAGEGCHGEADAAGCLSWDLRIPSAAVNHQNSQITIEADAQPGQWAWTCPAEDQVVGASAFHTSTAGAAPEELSRTGLGFYNHLYHGRHGEYVGWISSVSCTPEHLSLTYHVDFGPWSRDSYLLLEGIGATALAPGTAARSYSFTPTITTGQGAAPVRPTATATKPDLADEQATVTTERVAVEGEAKGAGRYAVRVRNDSSTPLSDFTVAGSLSAGSASITSLTCDLSALGGGLLTDDTPSNGISLHSGAASLPSGQSATCYLEATGVAGRNTISGSLTTAAGRAFTGDYQDNRPEVEVSLRADSAVQVQPADPIIAGESPYARITHDVTFSNRTDIETTTSDVVLRPQAPAGFTLAYVTAEGARWFHPLDPFLPSQDGTVVLGGSIPIGTGSSTTLTLHAVYMVDVEAVTRAGGWEALSTCTPGDSSKGMSTGLEISSGYGIEPSTHTTCTAVTAPAGL